MPLVQDRSLNMLTCSSACYYCATLDLCTRYPLLLGGQRWCGFKTCPRVLHMTVAVGPVPQPFGHTPLYVSSVLSLHIKVKACVSSPDIPEDSVNCTLITSRCWTHFLSLVCTGRMWRNFCCWSHSHNTNCCSIWYPFLLGGQRQCRFKACPRLLHMTVADF